MDEEDRIRIDKARLSLLSWVRKNRGQDLKYANKNKLYDIINRTLIPLIENRESILPSHSNLWRRKMTTINTWELWDKNFHNARNFFKSKGNNQTKGRLKKKWHDDFMQMFKDIEDALNKSKEDDKNG